MRAIHSRTRGRRYSAFVPDVAPIVVVGGTGRIGSELVRALTRLDARVRIPSRSPTAARRPGTTLASVDVIHADLGSPAEVTRSLAGAERAFLCLPAGLEQVSLETRFINAAAAEGIHVVKLSWNGAAIESRVPFGIWHREIERHLIASGTPFTIIHAATYSQHLFSELVAPQIRAEGVFRSSMGEGAVSFVDVRDIAALSAAVLTGSGHSGKTYTATGPEALSFRDAATILECETGRTVEYVDVPSEEVGRRLLDSGQEAWFAEAIVELYALYRDGAGASVSDDVERVTGRGSRRFRDYAKDSRDIFLS